MAKANWCSKARQPLNSELKRNPRRPGMSKSESESNTGVVTDLNTAAGKFGAEPKVEVQPRADPERNALSCSVDQYLHTCDSQFPRQHRIRIAKLKIGNHALAYLFAHSVARLLQGPVDIATHGIPELGLPASNTHFFDESASGVLIDDAYPWQAPKSITCLLKERIQDKLKKFKSTRTASSHQDTSAYARFVIRTNVPNLYPVRAYSVNSSLLIDIEGAVCNVGYLPSVQEARRLLPGTEELRKQAKTFHAQFDDKPLIVHIRAGDILDEHNRLYKTMKAEHIRSTAKLLNRRVVFIGQLEESDFLKQLKHEFPKATFAHTGSSGLDFAIIRSSEFVLLSTSTFAWLSAWLSEETKIIILPKTGMYNPEYAPEINLIDCSDKRFRFISS